jgi:hypothetical protein
MRVNNIIKLVENIHSYYQSERRNMNVDVDLGKKKKNIFCVSTVDIIFIINDINVMIIDSALIGRESD